MQGAETEEEKANRQAIEFLQKQHVHFLMPCYGGMLQEATFVGFLKFCLLANKIGLNYSVDTMRNESLITRGRNNLMSKMMFNTAATHLMFIDVDLGFEPEAIIRLLLANQDVVGGVYPMKCEPTRYVINTLPNPRMQGDLVEVSTLGTGFMLVKRHVLEKMIINHPELKYKDNIGFGAQYEPFMYSLFDTMIDEQGNYLSEDWTFCYRWRAMGGACWADTGIQLDHYGTHSFAGSVDKLKKVVTNTISNGGFVHVPGSLADISERVKQAVANDAGLTDTSSIDISE